MTVMIECHHLQPDIVAFLRGNDSSAELSRQLGYNFNKITRWEKGGSKMPWPDFVKLAIWRGIDVQTLLKIHICYEGDPGDAAALIAFATRVEGLTALARRLQLPKQTVNRWQKGMSPVPMISVLQALEPEVGFLDFLSHFAPTHSESYRKSINLRRKFRELHLRYPFIGMVLSAIEIVQKDSGKVESLAQISRLIGVGEDQIRLALEELSGDLILQKTNGKFRVAQGMDRVSTGEISDDMVRHWLARGQEILADDDERPRSQFGYCNLSLNDEGVVKLENLMAKFFQELSRLSADHSSSPSHIRNVTIQLLNPQISR